ncbi:hypothetical protein COT03_01645 [Candidatus Shapirobacteria bacterium CG07_land_8_20_14_0_80_39_18]|uniref:Uncharacterized protein n=1 Tax=Candidatus Shapirobacteria bacterium CG07_land_8_20_14_0_80_39_18 TaxID=1974882 RepID=A0A2M6YRE7_9BACT|nr:MAG: hypothetical protein COT03_01645 [Candidatus Shapirobacteria bacterium CG07_land_8_20_14_0_80_39_18]
MPRNNFCSQKQNYCVAVFTQARDDGREQKAAHSKQELKNPDVCSYGAEYLIVGWSPDPIAGRLRLDRSNDKDFFE